ncbi:J domain-containing protein [Burkholderia glumae]|uniref:J domain-containing protein n=1 Tax=Burkholderia glumae TaxID=337 RepID=UPI001295ED84|nr:J domain-containing protein [Burkholderia glumae]MCM2548073.1 J domain-containing protein [Burkholderia glumae]NVE21288.1 J domain-containing protein [Burkholderia glumae]QGA37444.1 molecular chaperone DnaJ [Burkholderia glumae]
MTDSSTGAIRLVPLPGAAGLSAPQRSFNTLTKQVAARRARLRAWEAVWPAFQQRYLDEWVPLARAATGHEAELVRRLDVAFDMKGLTKAERALVSELVVAFARPLLDGDAADGLHEIHARHQRSRRGGEAAGAAPPHGRDRKRAGTADDDAALARSGAPAAAAEDESDEAMMRHIQAELDAQEARAAAEAAARDAGRSQRRRASRRKSADAAAADDPAAQDGPDDAERAAAEAVPELPPVQISRSLRELYRRLASALHPDRETDPEEHARKTDLMQRLNRAYDRQDLLQLLELERDLNPAGADRLAGAGDELLQHYNGILKAQLGTLDRELHRVESDFRHGYGIGASAILAPDTALRTLGADIAALRRAVAQRERDLQAFRDLGSLKDWLRGFEA